MRIIGIDLGTTNSLVSFFEDNTTSLIANPSGAVITPSVVSLDEASGEVLIGEAAKDRLITHPSLSIANFKRLMGSEAKIRLGKKSFTPIELSSLILQQLKSDAENHFGEQITEAVISVPAYFSDAQRKATKLAGELAGLKVERLINEPTAAALAYGLHEKVQEQVFIVIDLGGGTLDISILDVFDDIIEVKASAGNNYFGGEDFTSALLKLFLSENKLKADKLSVQDNSKLYSAINRLKCKLSEASEGSIHIELSKKTIEWHCTREHYVNSIQELLKTFRTPIERAVKDSQIDIEELESVILVGGATRMPWIRAEVSKLFRRLPLVHINPDEAIARGAAVQAALKAKNQSFSDVVLTDVCPYTLGVETTIEKAKKHYESGHFSPIIERNMTVPVSRESSFVTISDNQTDINFGIFQGESRLTKNNVNIGNLSINVPSDKAGKQSVTVRFTYDINGILEVIVKSDSTGFTKSLIINSKNNGMSDEEIKASMAKLAEIKIHPRENLPNKELTARLERLYEENLGDKRAYIADILRTFEVALESQDPKHIEQVRNSILSNIAHLESDIF